jgi:YHS domain-containing protein
MKGTTMAIDPVCGMTVDEKSAAGAAVHAGKTWYFCSSKCQHEFDAAEARETMNTEIVRVRFRTNI